MRRSKLICILLCILTVLSLTGCGDIAPEVTMKDHTVTMKAKMQKIIDGGMVVADSTGHASSSVPGLSAREVSYDRLDLGVPAIADYEGSPVNYAGITVMLYNNSSSSADGEECQVHGINVNFNNPYNEKRGEDPVLINGINFNGMTAQEAISAMEGIGFKYNKEKEDLETLLFHSGDYMYTIRCEKQGTDYYVTDVEIKMNLDIKI